MIKKATEYICVVLLVIVSLLLSACSGGADKQAVSWMDLIGELSDVDRMARMDARPTHILTSYDRTGGNNDFNNFPRQGPDGWRVLADLEGPGYISRFWFTGARDGSHQLRMYFDGERKPSIDTTVGEFCGGEDPFLSPLAAYENYCWYSYLPIPYQKKLTVMIEDDGARQTEGGKPGGDSRLYFQINYSRLAAHETIESYPRELTEVQKKAVLNLVRDWKVKAEPQLAGQTMKYDIISKHNTSENICALPGPAVIREMRFRIDDAAITSAVARRKVLRDLILKINWNSLAPSSVEVPLGDLCGSMGQRLKFDSMYFGYDGTFLYCRFPMPFAEAADIALVNMGEYDVPVSVEMDVEDLSGWNSAYGYFHASWLKSDPDMVGRPHTVLRAEGSGKFVGCLLGATSFDRSWWLLESDESMRLDHAAVPQWNGTGLEDYFNGGWYYQNALARPLNGIVFKAPYRTVQYRIHFPDPVFFNSAFDMTFERGPGQASHGRMENVAYYYMEQPQAAHSVIPADATRYYPDDPVAKATFMTEVNNLERQADYQGAIDYIEVFLEKYPDFPFAEIIRMRKAAYKEMLDGAGSHEPAFYKPFLQSSNDLVRSQAEDLEWFYSDPNHALLGLYCNAPVRAFIDGEFVAASGRADKLEISRVEISPGEHVFALQSRWKQYPDWALLCLRTHSGDITTTPDCKYAFDAPGAWMSIDYDDDSWALIGGTGIKGPPEAPYVWLEPNAFVGMNAGSVGLRPHWDNRRTSFVVYRKAFNVPSER